ncbi:hypothetical protein NCS56_00181800 [Fusarium sp. Ph1]|nr:hypothetical protein NCS56_00181800 [Fusarium sp. Ph1]
METPLEHENPAGGDRTPKRRRLARSSSRRAQTSTSKAQQPRQMELSQPERPQSPPAISLTLQETRAEILARHKAWRDSALWTVYRELENGTILQTKVANLERDVSRLNQVVQMHKNETLAAGGVIRKLRAELETVRREAADRHADFDEKQRLEARNKELELEVTDTRQQLEVANKTLLEWKQQLTALIGDRAP